MSVWRNERGRRFPPQLRAHNWDDFVWGKTDDYHECQPSAMSSPRVHFPSTTRCAADAAIAHCTACGGGSSRALRGSVYPLQGYNSCANVWHRIAQPYAT
mmetsp:Transcript_148337/g.413213  ORF Transcript_148337/g.413213 Transcript_148337/m.413213 type:complete len:100 (-) Transcript_148337:271-570(-)